MSEGTERAAARRVLRSKHGGPPVGQDAEADYLTNVRSGVGAEEFRRILRGLFKLADDARRGQGGFDW